jgi:hypothetical protein
MLTPIIAASSSAGAAASWPPQATKDRARARTIIKAISFFIFSLLFFLDQFIKLLLKNYFLKVGLIIAFTKKEVNMVFLISSSLF